MTEKTVIWVAAYMPEVDAEIAIPVRGDGPALVAIEKKQVRLLTDLEAEQLNKRRYAEGPHMKKYLDDILAERWRLLKEQGYIK